MEINLTTAEINTLLKGLEALKNTEFECEDSLAEYLEKARESGGPQVVEIPSEEDLKANGTITVISSQRFSYDLIYDASETALKWFGPFRAEYGDGYIDDFKTYDELVVWLKENLED